MKAAAARMPRIDPDLSDPESWDTSGEHKTPKCSQISTFGLVHLCAATFAAEEYRRML